MSDLKKVLFAIFISYSLVTIVLFGGVDSEKKEEKLRVYVERLVDDSVVWPRGSKHHANLGIVIESLYNQGFSMAFKKKHLVAVSPRLSAEPQNVLNIVSSRFAKFEGNIEDLLSVIAQEFEIGIAQAGGIPLVLKNIDLKFNLEREVSLSTILFELADQLSSDCSVAVSLPLDESAKAKLKAKNEDVVILDSRNGTIYLGLTPVY